MESLHVGSLGKNSVLSRNSRKSWVCMCHPGPRAPLSRALWGPHWTQSMLGPTLEPSRSPVWTRGRSNPSWKQSAFIAPTGFVSAVHVRQRRKSPAVSKLTIRGTPSITPKRMEWVQKTVAFLGERLGEVGWGPAMAVGLTGPGVTVHLGSSLWKVESSCRL